MRYNRIDRTVTVEMGGREFALRFTLSGLEELESRTGLSFLDFLSSIGGGSPKLSHLVDAAWIAMKSGEPKLLKKDAEPLIMDYLRENGLSGLMQVICAAMGLSGILGPEGSAAILQGAGIEEETETKNGEAAQPEGKRRALHP